MLFLLVFIVQWWLVSGGGGVSGRTCEKGRGSAVAARERERDVGGVGVWGERPARCWLREARAFRGREIKKKKKRGRSNRGDRERERENTWWTKANKGETTAQLFKNTQSSVQNRFFGVVPELPAGATAVALVRPLRAATTWRTAVSKTLATPSWSFAEHST